MSRTWLKESALRCISSIDLRAFGAVAGACTLQLAMKRTAVKRMRSVLKYFIYIDLLIKKALISKQSL